MDETTSVKYTHLQESTTKEETFENVDSISIAANPETEGNTLIINHTNQKPNTVRNNVIFRRIT